jgi:dihydroorotase
MTVDMIIKNGTVVLPHASLRNHLILHEGKVRELTTFDDLPEARATIDASGLHVLPGLIDPHVHFRAPGLEYKEDFATGSRASAAGGITCILDMPNVVPPTWDVAGFEAKRRCAEGQSYVDFGFYGVIAAGTLHHILPLAEAGVCGFKIFMGESVGKIPTPADGEILEAWHIMRGTGLRCGVHAEDNSILFYLREKFQKQGRKDPMVHVEARPSIAEAECISRAIMFAEHCDSKLMIFHMSAKEGVAMIRDAKQRGVDVMGETAPHYLLCEAEDMVGRGLGSIMKVNPPVRTRDHARTLWDGVVDGTIDVIGSDHAPHSPEEKMDHDRFGDIWNALGGCPGVETVVPLMLTQVNEGKLTLNRYVELQAEWPAKAWNLWPRKGSLKVGSDADVTIVDMNKRAVVDNQKLHSKTKLSPFHGWHVKGLPVYTIVRGQVVAHDAQVIGAPIGQLQRPIVPSK